MIEGLGLFATIHIMEVEYLLLVFFKKRTSCHV